MAELGTANLAEALGELARRPVSPELPITTATPASIAAIVIAFTAVADV